MTAVIIAAEIAVILMWSRFAYVVVRRRAVRIEHDELSVEDKVFRLQRLSFVAIAGSMLVPALCLGVAAAVIGASHHSRTHHGTNWIAVLAITIYLVGALVSMVAAYRALRASLNRVRNTSPKAQNRRRLALLVALWLGVPVVLLGVGLPLLPRHGTGHAIGVVGLYLVVLVSMQALRAPTLVYALGARPVPEATRERLRKLARDMGVRMPDVRAFQGRQQKVANAMQVGSLPGLRYVLVSDYLLDNLPDDQVDAVMAHEFGHVRGHHLLVKLLTVLGTWAVLEAAVVGIAAATSKNAAVIALVPLLLVPAGFILVQGLLGVRLEERADDAAAATVGVEALADALDEMGRLNDTKRDTGRGWSLLTQHPGLDARVQRLREASTRRPDATRSSVLGAPGAG